MKRALGFLFGIWGFISLAVLVIFFGTISYLLSLFQVKSEAAHYFLLKAFSRIYLWSCGIRINIEGIGNIPGDNFILVSNYQTDIQHLAFIGYFPRKFRFVMSDILARSPFLGHLLRSSGFITINDLILQETTGWERSYGITKAIHYLTSGDIIFIMPEGRTSETGEMNPFNPGAVIMAYESSRPILPCATLGAHEIATTPEYSRIDNIRNNLPKIFITWISNYVRVLQSGNISIGIGHPIKISDIGSPRAETDKLRNVIKSMMDGMRAKS